MDYQDPKIDGLTPFKTFIFGIGHFLNDLSSAAGFNYALFYLINIQHVSTVTAGMVFLVAQISDSFSTPLVGYLSDRFNSRIGKRTPWYIFGTILMLLNVLVYQDCYACNSVDEDSRLIVEVFWYSIMIALDNMGWACIQISHMSLIPALTPSKEKKDMLISLRNAFTYIANIVTLLVAMILFNQIDDPKEQFLVLIVSLLGFGLFINILYLIVINERDLCRIADASYKELGALLLSSKSQSELSPKKEMKSSKVKVTWKDWLRRPQIYWIAMLYNMARLANNYVTSMIPFYLVYVIRIEEISEDVTKTPWQLALVPLIMYISSVLASVTQAKIQRLTRKTMYMIGSALIVVSAVSMFILGPSQKYFIILIVAVCGVGFSLGLNSSMGLISAFVGRDAQSGAVVWGMLGFVDKITSGVTVFVIANLGDLQDDEYTRFATCGILLLSAIIGGFCAFFIEHIEEYSEKDTN